MEPDTTDLASQLSQWTQRLNERQEALQSEHQRLQTFRNDYDALEKTLRALPDQTTRSAMIPIGKLAFMPGKLIHTNEITVYLGDQYYAERSAKQALGILERRKEVVGENLRLVEAQVNALQTKNEAGQGSLPSGDLGVNEEGLPIVEIREELPKEKAPAVAGSSKAPPSKPTAKTWSQKEQEDVMAMLQRLEEAEEAEGEVEQNDHQEKSSTKYEATNDKEDEDEDWENYDTEVADNLFDHFEDDEDYATQGVVDQVDASFYEEEDLADPDLLEEKSPEAATEQYKSIIDESPLKDSVTEKKPEPKQNEEKSTDTASDIISAADTPTGPKARKPSRFKVAKQKERKRPSAVLTKRDDADQPPKIEKRVVESETPAVLESPKELPEVETDFPVQSTATEQPANRVIPVVQESSQGSTESAKGKETKKKVSRFKLAREQERKATSPTQSLPTTTTSSPPPSKEKKPSKFKLTRQNGKPRAQDAGIDFSAVAVDKIPAVHDTRESSKTVKEKPVPEKPVPEKPKRKVTWDKVATVQEHDRSAAPSTVSSDSASPSYTAPVKEEQSNDNSLPLRPRIIKSPADIFSALQDQRQILLDDGYPSLETGEDDIHSSLDINSLTNKANFSSQEIWQLRDEPKNPLIMPIKESEVQPAPQARKTKLDSSTMKGAVMERETEPVDLDAVEQDMDLREVTSKYHNQRNSMVAAMGGYSFDQKDVYEVYDEDIPSYQNTSKESVEEEPEEKPRKVSRFKAARMAAMESNTE